MGKLVFVGDYVRIEAEGLPQEFDWAASLYAEVVHTNPSGPVTVRLLNTSSDTQFEVPGICCKKMRLYPFEVTFSRMGCVKGILAEGDEQAMDVADRQVTNDEVEWGETWLATDAELIEP